MFFINTLVTMLVIHIIFLVLILNAIYVFSVQFKSMIKL